MAPSAAKVDTQVPAPHPHPDKRDVLICGGGPAGLASALMLASRGWTGITVLEQQPSLQFTDPDRSYVYMIDGRGRSSLEKIGLGNEVQSTGLSTRDFVMRSVDACGRLKVSNLNVKDSTKVSHWMPRSALLKLLEGEVRRLGGDVIRVMLDTKATEVEFASSKGIRVTATTRTSEQSHVFEPRFLLGCDGINSTVRNALRDWCMDGSGSGKGDGAGPQEGKAGGGDSSGGHFDMVYAPSASAGLRFKTLQFPPNPEVAGGIQLPNHQAAILWGVPAGPMHAIRLGSQPISDQGSPRNFTLITRPGHHVWELTSSEEMYAFLESSLPQVPIRRLVPEEVINRFAASRGGTFPVPQYSRGMQMVLTGGDISGGKAASGVVLLGDAAHAFPPDIGQGVNSALQDVEVLGQALDSTADDLSAALPEYEARREGDVVALIRMMQIAFPYQYNQAPMMRKVWYAGFALQLLLHRMLPFAVSPPVFMMVQDPSLSYSRIMELQERTLAMHRILATAALALALAVMAAFLR